MARLPSAACYAANKVDKVQTGCARLAPHLPLPIREPLAILAPSEGYAGRGRTAPGSTAQAAFRGRSTAMRREGPGRLEDAVDAFLGATEKPDCRVAVSVRRRNRYQSEGRSPSAVMFSSLLLLVAEGTERKRLKRLMKMRQRLSALEEHGHLSQFGTEGLDDGFIGLVGVHPSPDPVLQPAKFLAELGLGLAESANAAA